MGCGGEFALGALHATAGLDLKPRERLAMALAAAGHHSAGVSTPFSHVTARKGSS
ncbi:hypothetical protein [Streptomyces sp. NPDC001404]|uniref:hypothetical protein n=1 Tax=Streptomyces sp. NPDC001404 TaxID=3364571 RepID=UPI00367E6258